MAIERERTCSPLTLQFTFPRSFCGPLGFRNLHQHIALFHLTGELLLADLWSQAVLTGADVELPAVPGTGDDAAPQHPFADRATSVGADAVHRVEFTIDVVDRDNATTNGELAALTGGDVFDGADGVPHGEVPDAR